MLNWAGYKKCSCILGMRVNFCKLILQILAQICPLPKSLYLWIEISLKFRPVIRIDNRSFQKLPFQNWWIYFSGVFTQRSSVHPVRGSSWSFVCNQHRYKTAERDSRWECWYASRFNCRFDHELLLGDHYRCLWSWLSYQYIMNLYTRYL